MYQTYDQRLLEGKRGASLYVAVRHFFFVKILMLLIITPSSVCTSVNIPLSLMVHRVTSLV